MLGMRAESRYCAEKIYIEQRAILSPKGTEDSVKYSQKLYAMKAKMNQLNNSVIDTVKVGLQAKYNAEDEYHAAHVGFPNDSVERTSMKDMRAIEAQLLEPFRPQPHLKLETFMGAFLVQPWQAQKAVEDVRQEENIRTRELALDRMQTELRGVKAKIKDTKELIKLIDKQMEELEREIHFCEDDLRQDRLEEDEAETTREKIELLTRVSKCIVMTMSTCA